MEFDITQFEFTSQDPYFKINNRQFFKIREKKNPQKIFTFLIIDGAIENIQMKTHIHCQGIDEGIIKIKGFQNMDFFDSFGLKIKRQGYLMEEFQESLIQVSFNNNIDEKLIESLIRNIINILAKLQEEEIAVPYLTPEQIVRTKDGEFKIMDIDHAVNVLGMDSSVQREIKGNHHYMDNETFTASAHGLTSTIQNYFKSVVYSLGLIALELSNYSFSNHRLTQDEIDFMMNEFSNKCPRLINLLQSMLIDSKGLRPDCVSIRNALQFLNRNYDDNEEFYQNEQLIQNTLSWTGQYTVSQPLYLNYQSEEQSQKQIQELPNESYVLSENCQTVVQSGIKLPETLRNQIKQWQVQRMNPSNQFQDITSDYQQQNSIQNSSDQIEQQYFDKMTFIQLQEILQKFPLIIQIKLRDIFIDDQLNIDEQQKVLKCKYQGEEKVIKVYYQKPAYQILQLLNNITHIQKLKIPGLCSFEGYSLEECENDIYSGNLYLLTNVVNCDLERAIRVQQIKSIKTKFQIISNIAKCLKFYNTYFIHGNLKPSNILLDNQLNIFLTDYGLGDVKGEIDQQLYSSRPTCIYSSPEKTLTNNLSGTSDVWSFGIIIYEILSGQIFTQQQITKFGMKDFDKQGCLQPDKIDFPFLQDHCQKLINLIKKMTQFQSHKRPSSSEVQNELEYILKSCEQQQTPIQNKMIQPNLSKNYSIQSQNSAQQYYPSNQLMIQQSPSFQTIKKTNQTPAGKIHRNTGFQQRYPPASARQQRQEKTGGEFYIQGKTLNLQPQEIQKSKK